MTKVHPFLNNNVITLKSTNKSNTNYNSIESLPQNMILDKLSHGEFDDNIIKVFKMLKIDLKRNTTGCNWMILDSAYRNLAFMLGIDPTNNLIVHELYNIIMYNKRLIRDRIIEISPIIEDDPCLKIDYINIYNYEDEIESSLTPFTLDVLPKSPTPSKHDEKPTFPKYSAEDTSFDLLYACNKITNIDRTFSNEIYGDPKTFEVEPKNFKKRIKQSQPMSAVKSVEWSIFPEKRTCPRCYKTGHTRIHYRTGYYTWSCVAGLCISGIGLPFFWIPFVSLFSKDVLHLCGRCKFILGKVVRKPFNHSEIKKNQEIIVDENNLQSKLELRADN